MDHSIQSHAPKCKVSLYPWSLLVHKLQHRGRCGFSTALARLLAVGSSLLRPALHRNRSDPLLMQSGMSSPPSYFRGGILYTEKIKGFAGRSESFAEVGFNCWKLQAVKSLNNARTPEHAILVLIPNLYWDEAFCPDSQFVFRWQKRAPRYLPFRHAYKITLDLQNYFPSFRWSSLIPR